LPDLDQRQRERAALAGDAEEEDEEEGAEEGGYTGCRATGSSWLELRFQRSRLPWPSTDAKTAGCDGDLNIHEPVNTWLIRILGYKQARKPRDWESDIPFDIKHVIFGDIEFE
jgi:hypothetical protein